MAPLPLELAVFSASDALLAQTLGASRIELNAPGSYPSGGLTPPVSLLLALSPQLHIPLRVMIRPRGPLSPSRPDFIYTAAELDAMRTSITEMKASGVMDGARGDGFVFGILQGNGGDLAIDEEKCKELVELARPIPCVFHRAFDPVQDCEGGGVDVLLRCGFEGLLTAGGAEGGCVDNLERLARICERARGRIEVVAGGGVRHHNVTAAVSVLGRFGGGEGRGVWVHSAALKGDGSGMDEEEVQRLLAELAK